MTPQRAPASLATSAASLLLVLSCLGTVLCILPPPVDLEISGDGMPSGSGEPPTDTAGPPTDTAEPPSCSFVSSLVTEQPKSYELELLPEIRCHLACLQHYITDDPQLLLNSTQVVPTNDWFVLPDSVLNQDCILFQKVHECRAGCFRHLQRPTNTKDRCRRLCLKDCNESCSSHQRCAGPGTTCLRQCDDAVCEFGCGLAQSDLAMEKSVPPKPRHALVLTIPKRSVVAGRYHVKPSSLVVGSPRSGANLSLTGFIVRAVFTKTNSFAFYWLPSFEDFLDLEVFACAEKVVVTYAAINTRGRSEWSSPTHVNVYGEPQVVENPDSRSFNFSVEADTRFGFWKHVSITVSWERPSRTLYLSCYSVSFSSTGEGCVLERGQTQEIGKEAISASLVAHNPGEGPLNGCTYNVTGHTQPLSLWGLPCVDPARVVSRCTVSRQQVAAVSIGPESAPQPSAVELQVDVENPIPLNFQCNQDWDPDTAQFHFSLTWMVPNSPFLLSSIGSFSIVVDLLQPNNTSQLDEDKVTFMSSKMAYTYRANPLSHSTDPGELYLFTLLTRPSSPLARAFIPEPHACLFGTSPPPPPPPQTIAITSQVYSVAEPGTSLVQLEVTIEWLFADEPGAGRLVQFELRVFRSAAEEEVDMAVGREVGEEVVGEEVGSGEVVVEEVVLSAVYSAQRSDAVIKVYFEVPAEPGCLFLQLRSHGELNTFSNWSAPLCLQMMPATPTEPSAEPPLPRYIYFVVAIGGAFLIGILILALCVCCACIQNKKLTEKVVLARQSSFKQKQGSAPSAVPSHYHSPVVKAAVDQWELHPSMVVVERRLGEGAFGTVYEGTAQGMAHPAPPSSASSSAMPKVAVKLLSATASDQEKQNFFRHIMQAKRIGKTPHPHLVSMLGCVTLQQPVCLVLDLPERGSLLALLESCRKQILVPGNAQESLKSEPSQFPTPYLEVDGEYSHLEESPFEEGRTTVMDLLSYAHQIATGMEYLAYLGVVHGDLACRNVFIDGNGSLKVSDFGLSQPEKEEEEEEEGAYLGTVAGRLPWRWMAIESLVQGKFSSASDVWGFGVTLWEIVTLGGRPYPNTHNRDLVALLQQSHRLEKPSNCSQELYDVMYQCWNEKPLNRSTFTQHRLTFESFLSSPTPPNRLVTMEIDEQKPYYHYINRHEPLHRLSAQPSPGGNRPIAMVTVPNNPSNQYADRVLPRIVEEKEGSDVEAGGGSGWSSPAHGYSEETGSTDDGGSHGSHEPMITSTI